MKTAPFFVIVLALLFSSSIMAQTPGAPAGAVPAGGGDKNLQVDDSKMRSMELERVKRDAEKPDKKTKTNLPPPAPNFEQVKQDFESIQRLQDDIITAYSKSVVIDFKRISEDAIQMNQSASRLEENLFPLEEKKKESKKAVAAEPIAQLPEQALPQDVKSLIVEQDSAVSSFVSSPMFINPKVIDQQANAKSHADLQRLIKLSAALQQEADKLKK
jgi:hypothetical protein